MATRYVKLGRTPIIPVPVYQCTSVNVHHWAVQVGDTWYEINANGKSKVNSIATTSGKVAKSGAGRFGGEFVGKTTKSDAQIEDFNRKWVSNNPTYNVFTDNCQKFAINLIRWLTDNCYRLPHQPDAANLGSYLETEGNTIALAHEGQAFASAHLLKAEGSSGPVSTGISAGSVGAEAIAGNGFGAWADASLVRAEMGVGPFGASVGLNANTGAGVRGGNLDVHLLGFGIRAGTDGFGIDTPGAGVTCCLM